MEVSAGGQSWSVLGSLHRGEQSNVTLQWAGPRGTSSGDDRVLPMVSHPGGYTESWGALWWGILVFSSSKELD